MEHPTWHMALQSHKAFMPMPLPRLGSVQLTGSAGYCGGLLPIVMSTEVAENGKNGPVPPMAVHGAVKCVR